MPQLSHQVSQAELVAQQATQAWEDGLCQLGQELQKIRQAKSLSIQELHTLTLVPLYHLQALELGQVEKLPEAVYVRGFVRRIGNALGLDGDHLVATLPPSDPNKGLIPCWAESKPESEFYLRPVHLYVSYAALMAGAVSGLAATSQPVNSEVALNSSQLQPSEVAMATTHDSKVKPTLGLKSNFNGWLVEHGIATPEVMPF
ncbi:MAG: helix-turn-helix domain-containing protein [Leptolyngbyaceae bacterium]|nr:helix-turn-helix domain-containing protein [Leptolyngbyaceae bacterium]